MTVLGAFAIPNETRFSRMEGRRTDFVDMVSFTPGIVAIIYYLSEGPVAGWKAASTLAPLVVGIALLISLLSTRTRSTTQSYSSYLEVPATGRILRQQHHRNCQPERDSLLLLLGASRHPPLYGFEERTDYIVHGVGITALISHMVQQIQAYRTKITIIGWLFLTAAGVVKSIADANDEDQRVVGTMYNVGLRLGAPVAVALNNIIANSHNSPTAVGAGLLPGYHAAFYTEALLGGIGLLIAILYAAHRDPVVVAGKPESALQRIPISGLSIMLLKSRPTVAERGL